MAWYWRLRCPVCRLEEPDPGRTYCTTACKQRAKYERAKARERARLERRERAA